MAGQYVPMTGSAEPAQAGDKSVLVLSVSEVAVRLQNSKAEVKRMIAAGKMRALAVGWTVVVPTSEVERLRSHG